MNTLLLLIALPLASMEGPVTVLAEDGIHHGDRWTLDAGGTVLLQGPDARWTLRGPALVDAGPRLVGPPPLGATQALAYMRNGEVLQGALLDGDGAAVELDHARLGRLSLPSDDVDRLLVGRRHLPPAVRAGVREVPCLALTNGDLLPGAASNIGPDGVTVASVFGDSDIPLSRVAGVLLTDATVMADQRAPGALRCELTDGQVWFVASLTPAERADQLRLVRQGVEVVLEVAALQRVVFAGWRVEDMTQVVAHTHATAYLGGPSPVALSDAAPRMVGGRAFRHGTTTRPRTALTLALDPATAFLFGWVGLAPLAGRDGRCDVAVLDENNAPLWRADALTASDGVRQFAIALDSPQSLTLLTDFGPLGELHNVVHWCEAGLLVRR